MEFTKRYRSGEPSFYLLPGFVESIMSSQKLSADPEDSKGLVILQEYNIGTRSQKIVTEDPEEFKDILRNVNEPISYLSTQVKYQSRFRRIVKPLVFDFYYDLDEISITLAWNDAKTILQRFSEIEEALSLEVVGLEILRPERVAREKTIFLAHSFNQTGKSYAYEIIKFLSLINFEVSTGEGFSPERISRKVRKRLKSQEVVIAIISENEDMTWLLQEAAGAAFIDKPLMLLIEEGIEFKPGILGDLEYVEFPKDHVSETFVSILEGFQELGYSFE